MSDKAVAGAKEVQDFLIKLSKYQKRSMDRIEDYLNADKGVPEHEIRTVYEWLNELDERLSDLEDVLSGK